MTITKNYQEFTTASGETMWMEQYRDKSFAEGVWFWRYGKAGYIWKSMLLSRPNKKRLIATY